MPELSQPWDFVGISTREGHKKLYDLDLVKEDLMNWFSTRRGELDWAPDYGSIVPELLFELKNDTNKQALEDDVRRGIATEPRLTLTDLVITEQEYGYTVEIQANYLEQNPPIQFTIDFDERQFGERIT